MAETIKIKYFSDDIERLKPIDGKKSDWIDLRSAEDVKLSKGEFYILRLGVGMKLPEGYEAHIVPRSSTFLKWGVIQPNNVGIIDNSYSGDNDEWKLPLYATKDVHIHLNDRLCQFRIVRKQDEIIFDEVEHLDSTDRGGFGSTGSC